MVGEFWITTASGGRFYYDTPLESDITVEDIAHHLSHVGRFAGATTEFWSVCQHSLLVAWIILNVLKGSARSALFGLLHDGHEAFINDIPTPFAEFLEAIAGAAIIENAKHAYDAAIYKVLLGDLPNEEDMRLIKMADKIALVTEAKQFVKNSSWTARFPVEPVGGILVPLPHEEAKADFISEFRHLYSLYRREQTHAA